MNNPIPKMPKEEWIKVFGAVVVIAMEKGYLDDFLEFGVYKDYFDLPDDYTPEEEDIHYENIWARVYEAYEEVFGMKVNENPYV